MTETRYFFFDIDGTIAVSDEPPSQATLAVLARLKKNGHKRFICTGRPLCDIPSTITRIDWDGVISGCGALVSIDGKELYRSVLPYRLVRRTVELLYTHRITAILESPEEVWWIPGAVPVPDFVLDGGSRQIDPARIANGTQAQSFTLWAADSADMQRIVPDLINDYTIYLDDDDRYAELIGPGQNKGAAMMRVLEHFGAGPEAAIALGDSNNDGEILQQAGVGIAMGNAPSALRHVATIITGTVKEEGVATAITNLGF
ncbi:MAG: Cof-type HAD-IIB family hydrolase [Planctomycetes bacterium]|nr:Cof-type HAD-IIB family hydrolase [Planctomycetota bacterium]